jgi:NitT/TauT family transport system substrate-binding protein
MFRTLGRLRYAVLILALLALVGAPPGPSPATVAASGPAPAAPAPQLTAVRFGSPQSTSDAGVYLGRARGFFREQGLDVDTLAFQSGPDLIPPMASGELQVGGGGLSLALLNAFDRGVRIRIVADKGNNRLGFDFTQFPVRRDLLDSGEVRGIADLRGRRVGVSALRASGEAITAQMLAQAGIGIDEVELVPMSYPDMVPAFGNRAIDVAVLIEPSLSAAFARGVASAWEPGIVSAAYGGVYQAAMVLYSEQFAAQPELARRFMLAYLQGVRVYLDAFLKGQDRADVIRVLFENTPIKDAALYDRMIMAGLDPDGQIHRPSLQIEYDYHRGRGYYSGSATLDDLIDTSFVQAAAQQLGPYQ